MSGRLVQELEYHYSDGAFGDGPHANITIHYYRKKYQFARYRHANISNFTVYISIHGVFLVTYLAGLQHRNEDLAVHNGETCFRQ